MVKIRKKICKSEKKVLSLQRKTQNKEKMETKETKQEQTNHKSLWELAKEWKGNLTVNDPVFLL